MDVNCSGGYRIVCNMLLGLNPFGVQLLKEIPLLSVFVSVQELFGYNNSNSFSCGEGVEMRLRNEIVITFQLKKRMELGRGSHEILLTFYFLKMAVSFSEKFETDISANFALTALPPLPWRSLNCADSCGRDNTQTPTLLHQEC